MESDFTLLSEWGKRSDQRVHKRMAKRGSGNISPPLFYHGPIILCVQKMAAQISTNVSGATGREERDRQNHISIFAMEPLSKSFDLYPLVDMSRESSKGNGLLIVQYDCDASTIRRFYVYAINLRFVLQRSKARFLRSMQWVYDLLQRRKIFLKYKFDFYPPVEYVARIVEEILKHCATMISLNATLFDSTFLRLCDKFTIRFREIKGTFYTFHAISLNISNFCNINSIFIWRYNDCDFFRCDGFFSIRRLCNKFTIWFREIANCFQFFFHTNSICWIVRTRSTVRWNERRRAIKVAIEAESKGEEEWIMERKGEMAWEWRREDPRCPACKCSV